MTRIGFSFDEERRLLANGYMQDTIFAVHDTQAHQLFDSFYTHLQGIDDEDIHGMFCKRAMEGLTGLEYNNAR